MPFDKILCVLNATHHADDVLSHAVHIAQKNKAQLTVLLALDSLPPSAKMVMESASYVESLESIENHASTWLDDKMAYWSQQYPMTSRVTVGDPIENIEDVIYELLINLVIRHTEEGIIDAIAGTDDIHLIHKAPCPVLLTNRKLPKDYNHVLIAIDANYHYEEDEVASRDQLNQLLLNQGLALAEKEGAQCTVVSVYDVYPSALLGDGFISIPVEVMDEEAKNITDEQHQVIDALLENSGSDYKPDILVERGNARTHLPEVAKRVGADIVVMGTVARVGIPGLLIGNTLASVISQLECAVLAFKPEQG